MSKYFCRNCSCEVLEQGEHVMQADCIKALAAEIAQLRTEVDEVDCRVADAEYDIRETGNALDELEYRLNARLEA